MVGRLSARTDYNVEAAIQRGSLGTDTISAWAGHALFGRTMPIGSKTYRAFGEYNYASGDDTPTDGVRGTFDQLYPTPHDKYGLADQFGAGCEVLTLERGLPASRITAAISDAWDSAARLRPALRARAAEQVERARAAYARLPSLVAVEE